MNWNQLLSALIPLLLAVTALIRAELAHKKIKNIPYIQNIARHNKGSKYCQSVLAHDDSTHF